MLLFISTSSLLLCTVGVIWLLRAVYSFLLLSQSFFHFPCYLCHPFLVCFCLLVVSLIYFFLNTASWKSLFAIFRMVSSSLSADLFCFHRITSVHGHIWGPLCNVNHGLFSFGFILGIWCLYQKLVSKLLTWNRKFQTYKTLITWFLYSSLKIHYTVGMLCSLVNMLAGILAS